MPTLNQLIRHGREEKRRTDRTRASDQCPQKQGVRPRVSTRTPKKPNSAPRKIAKVRLSNRHDIFAHIPGEGHNSQEHSMVLIRGGRVKDLPGVKSHCIRGVKDLLGIPDRRADLLTFLLSILIALFFYWVGFPVPIIASFCAEGDEAGFEGGNDQMIPYLKAPSPGGPVEILIIPESPTSPTPLSPLDQLPSIEEGDKVATPVRHSQKSSFFIQEIPPYRGKDLVEPQRDHDPLAVEEALNRLIHSFRSLFKASSFGERPPGFIKGKQILSKQGFSLETLLSLRAELQGGDPNCSAFKEILALLKGETP
ncbi:hypothetical protein VNO77_47730 [Canavalia gladiata]|uniref:Ribosomal protein S12 n=1 Tax=Canavalia gladiata TaxID=3824 RepID=A0AAN9JES0_CANGL